MQTNLIWLLLSGLYAACATWGLCRWGRPIALRYALMDIPDGRKRHRHSTPLIGGLAIIVSLTPIMPVLMMLFDPADIGNTGLTVLGGCTIVSAMIGITDDRHSVSARVRLLASILLFASAIAIDQRFLITEVRFTGIAHVLHLPLWLAWPFTLTVLIGFLNAVNMSDGKNGLVTGMSLGWCLLLTLVGPSGIAILVFPVAIMLTVILIFNINGRVFLGDGGAYGLAAIFGLTSVYSYNAMDPALTADLMTLFFIVPGIDMIRLFIERIRAGYSPAQGGRDHFHHHLLDAFGWQNGLLIYLSLTIIPALIATFLRDWAFALLGLTLLIYALLLRWTSRRAEVSASPPAQQPE